MRIKNLKHAEEILQTYIPNAFLYTGDGLSLDRMWPLLKIVGDPQEKLKVVHVAGTSGKTSSAYFIASLLKTADISVGLTVSPHVDSIAERVQINGKPISEYDFCSYLEEFLKLIQPSGLKPSYFELMIVFILWVFYQQGVDYAVVETGMGGALDSTNVITRQDKVCVITDVGLDHTAILGRTLSKIASQKAGIIHSKNEVFTHEQSKEIMSQMISQTNKVNANLNIVEDYSRSKVTRNLQFENLPMYQRKNWNIALHVASYIAKRDKLKINQDLNPLTVTVPGRMEQVKLFGGLKILMDGAHNAQKMTAFIESVQEKFPDRKFTVLLALKEGKEYKEVIAILQPLTEKLIVTTFSTSQDLPVVSQEAEVIADYAVKLGMETVVVKDHKKAFTELVNTNGNFKIVTGSFYLLGQIRSLVKQ